MFSKKLVIVPVFVALTVSMSACGDPHSADNTSKSGSITQVKPTPEPNSDEGTSGGIGMTYTGKMGIDMGGGMVMPMSGGMPQMGFGF